MGYDAKEAVKQHGSKNDPKWFTAEPDLILLFVYVISEGGLLYCFS